MSDKKIPSLPKEEALLARSQRINSVPKKGIRMKITLSDEEKSALCAFYKLQDIKSFEVNILLQKRTTTKFQLTGNLHADVTQTCVVSLEPVKTQVDEEIDLSLVPENEFEKYIEKTDEEGLLMLGLDEDVPDTYQRDVIEVGAFILEHFALGLNPYPHAAGVTFTPHAVTDEKQSSAFAKLAALKEKMKPS